MLINKNTFSNKLLNKYIYWSGIITLLFILITKGKAPAYLGSSFAFLSPGLLVASKFGFQYALGGFVVLGICGMIVALIIRQCGTNWIDIVLWDRLLH